MVRIRITKAAHPTRLYGSDPSDKKVISFTHTAEDIDSEVVDLNHTHGQNKQRHEEGLTSVP
jgi:hypothetical protein